MKTNTAYLRSRVKFLEILISEYLRIFFRTKVQLLHHEARGANSVALSGEALSVNIIMEECNAI